MRRNLYKITHNQNLHVGVNKISFSGRRHDTVSRRQSLHGFTLIELLVVISIVALLMSILMPALGKVKALAQKTVCLSNLRSIGHAVNLYVADNGTYGQGKAGTDNYGVPPKSEVSWIRDIAPYIEKTAKILICPVARKPSQATELTTGYGTPKYSWRWDWGGAAVSEKLFEELGLHVGDPISYAYNEWCTYPDPKFFGSGLRESFGQEKWKVKYTWKSPDNIRIASDTPLLGDGRWMYGLPLDDDVVPEEEEYEWFFDNNKWGMNMFTFDRHGGPSINMLYADGSVRNTPLSELYEIKWHREFNTKNEYVTDPERMPTWMK